MTAIAPNTTVWLINTLLTSGSEDTFYFDSLSAQTSYFDSRKLIGLTNYTYQREQRHFIKVGVNGSEMATTIKNANYMMWQNSSYENKNYYAFITEAEWINNEVVKLYFEMDYIQTYYFNYISSQCYISRQHSETDYIGDNILPEPVELGEYVTTGGNVKCLPRDLEGRDSPCIVIALLDDSQSTGRLNDGVFSAVELHVFGVSSTGVQEAQNLINRQAQHPERILAIYASRYLYVGLDPSTQSEQILASSARPLEYGCYIPTITDQDSLDDYIPKNNKLYTYPYTFFSINNGKGADMNLRYEWWKRITGTDTHRLTMLCTRSMPVTIQIRPFSYKGEDYANSDSDGMATDTFVELSGQPMGSNAIDSYESWRAQNEANIVGAGLKTGIGAGVAIAAGVATGNPLMAISGVSSIADSVINTGTSAYNASIAADKFSGSLSGSAINYDTDVDGFYYRRLSVNRQYAKSIDNFFTMFGYTQNKIGTPNRHARTRYTYVRTVGFNPMGNIPQDARKFISARYDAGVRFWVDHESNSFCNYTLDNNPLS